MIAYLKILFMKENILIERLFIFSLAVSMNFRISARNYGLTKAINNFIISAF